MVTAKHLPPGRSDAVIRALLLIPQHPEVLSMGSPLQDIDGGVEVDVTYRVNLPTAWRAIGESPNGTRTEEVVRFHFPADYPISAPVPSLRPDFDRTHPHMTPGMLGDRPLPCIADISLNSLLHQQGLRGILNQTALWLDNAAIGILIDPAQGWEPIRRDDLPHAITADAESLRLHLDRDGGHLYFSFEYALLNLVRGGVGVRGRVELAPIVFRPETIASHVSIKNVGTIKMRRSIVMLVWPGKNPAGKPFVCKQYRPENVNTFRDLLLRAQNYGCEHSLVEQLNWLRRCAANRTIPPEIHVAIILCVRRPIHLIGSESDMELICYIAKYSDLASTAWKDTVVEPAAHNQQIGVALCRKLSGVHSTAGHWTLIGAGSIGSKIALHLARQGMAPSHIVDRAIMRAHNAIRHGLLPVPEYFQSIWTTYKANLLCESIATFAQSVEPVQKDVVESLRSPEERRRIISKTTTFVVNSAASIRVREVLAMLPVQEMGARVVETSLFADGQVGLVTVEGHDRNANTGDLISEFYRIVGATPSLRRILFDSKSGLSRVSIGEGCGSATMVLSDAKLSIHTAAMAQVITKELSLAHDKQLAKITIGVCGDDGISVVWSHYISPKIKSIAAKNLPAWTVRVSEKVETAILKDINRWPGVETGGIIMGRISEISRTFYVVDLLPAPTDSSRSAQCFTLGIQGIKSALRKYYELHGCCLYCLGTWHSHLGSSAPSSLDALTTQTLALARTSPSLLLIKAPEGYSAMIADSANRSEI